MDQTSNGSILRASENLFFVCGEGLVFSTHFDRVESGASECPSNPPPGRRYPP